MTGKKKRDNRESRNSVVNVRVPDELILELDFLVSKRIFKSRSEAIREFAREYVQENILHLEENAKDSGQGGGRW